MKSDCKDTVQYNIQRETKSLCIIVCCLHALAFVRRHDPHLTAESEQILQTLVGFSLCWIARLVASNRWIITVWTESTPGML